MFYTNILNDWGVNSVGSGEHACVSNAGKPNEVVAQEIIPV